MYIFFFDSFLFNFLQKKLILIYFFKLKIPEINTLIIIKLKVVNIYDILFNLNYKYYQ